MRKSFLLCDPIHTADNMTNSPNEVNPVNAVTLPLLGESAKIFCLSMKSTRFPLFIQRLGLAHVAVGVGLVNC